MSHKAEGIDYDQELLEALMVFGRDEDGFISAGELRRTLKAIGEEVTDDELDEMIREADTDNDGRISCETDDDELIEDLTNNQTQMKSFLSAVSCFIVQEYYTMAM
ncbi:hypothetical protein ACHAPO_005900 [Fusarium lateritium]